LEVLEVKLRGYFLVFVTALAASLLTACAPGGGSEGEQAEAEFFVSFLLDGNPIEMAEGILEYDNVPFATYSPSDVETLIGATPVGVSIDDTPTSYVVVYVYDAPGPGTYTFALGELELQYVTPGLEIWLEDGSVTITSAGGVGGAIEGTFEGTLSDLDEAPTYYEVTEGRFRVKRLPDDLFGGGGK